MKDKVKLLLYKACGDTRVYEDNIDLLEEIIDSFVLIEIISEIENEFGVELQPTEIPIDNLRSVEGIVELIERELTKYEQ